MMEVIMEKIKTSPELRAKAQAYLEGLEDARRLLREEDNLIVGVANLSKKINSQRREVRKML